jgi:hypothetical protein
MKTRKVTINVTQKHIDKGAQKYCYRCPITLAVLEALELSQDGPDGIILGTADCYVCFYNKDSYQSKLPQVAVDFIECFDRNKGLVSPFSFELEIPV